MTGCQYRSFYSLIDYWLLIRNSKKLIQLFWWVFEGKWLKSTFTQVPEYFYFNLLPYRFSYFTDLVTLQILVYKMFINMIKLPNLRNKNLQNKKNQTVLLQIYLNMFIFSCIKYFYSWSICIDYICIDYICIDDICILIRICIDICIDDDLFLCLVLLVLTSEVLCRA